MKNLIQPNQKHNNFFSSLKVLRHSLATPITNLLLNLELLSQALEDNEADINYSVYLQRCLTAAKYLQQILRNSDLELNDQTATFFQIKPALHEVLEICGNPRKKGILLPFIQLSGRESLQGYKLHFQEAIVCLLNNAFESYQEHAPNKLVLLSAQCSDQQLKIRVTDAGQGFLCLKDTGKNLVPITNINDRGVGLSVVDQVIRDHFKGKVLIKSQPNQGSSVCCSLPLAKK